MPMFYLPRYYSVLAYLHFRIYDFNRIYKDLLPSWQGCAKASVRFTFDGNFISEDETPTSLEMEENDVIEVHVEPSDATEAGVKSEADANVGDFINLKVMAQVHCFIFSIRALLLLVFIFWYVDTLSDILFHLINKILYRVHIFLIAMQIRFWWNLSSSFWCL